MATLVRTRPAPPPVKVTVDPELARYRELIKLDRHALDTAAEEQAQLFLDVCDKHTQAISLRDEAKEALEHTDAEISSKIRLEALDKKPTESAIKEQVIQSTRHAAANVDYEYKKRTADFWGNLRAAFDQRAKMIRELTGQYSAGYFTVQSSVQARKNGVHTGREAMHAARTAPK